MKLNKNVAALLLLAAACSKSGEALLIAPFPDRPEERYEFRFQDTTVSGMTWKFERDGDYANNIGPISFTLDGFRAPVVAIEGLKLALSSPFEVVNSNRNEIRDLILAAEEFCRSVGYVRTGRGANISAAADQILLVGFCAKDPS